MVTAKKNTAMVYNPGRKLTGVKTTSNPVKKRTKNAARKNPATKKVVNASSHKRRRRPVRRNPAGLSGLIIASLMAGVGVWGFDVLTNKFMPNGSALVRVGVKFGGAYLLNSSFGAKLPVLGKYKNEIALVLAVSGVVDLLQIYVLPTVQQFTGGLLNFGSSQGPQPVALVEASPELSGVTYYTVEDATEVDEEDEDEELFY